MNEKDAPPKRPCPSVAQIVPGALTRCELYAGHAGPHVGHNGKWISPNDGKTA